MDYFLLGRARKRVDANLVIKHLKEAIRINPDDAKAYHILGLLYQFLGQVLTVYRVDAKDALKQDAIDAFKQAIRIKNGYIYIQGSPILHSEVLVHKQQILEKIKEILPESNFIDIK